MFCIGFMLVCVCVYVCVCVCMLCVCVCVCVYFRVYSMLASVSDYIWCMLWGLLSIWSFVLILLSICVSYRCFV